MDEVLKDIDKISNQPILKKMSTYRWQADMQELAWHGKNSPEA